MQTVKLKEIYQLILFYYNELSKESYDIRSQNTIRERLNGEIRNYINRGGKRDIKRFCKYYV